MSEIKEPEELLQNGSGCHGEDEETVRREGEEIVGIKDGCSGGRLNTKAVKERGAKAIGENVVLEGDIQEAEEKEEDGAGWGGTLDTARDGVEFSGFFGGGHGFAGWG